MKPKTFLPQDPCQRTLRTFPGDFIWGAATAAYQIEGAVKEGGRGPSIWDTFSHTPGKTHAGDTGDVAADHYQHWEEDVELMAELGLNAYRFSIAWPRILPQGTGEVNATGLDFYDRLVDALLARGIEPYVTLYHWDLPQPLEDAGGWPHRDTAEAFADYTRVVAERLGDRVTHWITHNEPWVVAFVGYVMGHHAPGREDSIAGFQAAHHLLLSHSYATDVLRTTIDRPIKVGIAIDLNPVHPATADAEDETAATRFDVARNQLFLDPLFNGTYPKELTALPGPFFDAVQENDLKQISAPIDFLGINYYTRSVVAHDPAVPLIQARQIQPKGNEYSQMWEIYPEGFYEILTRVHNDYAPAEVYITENGIPVPEGIDADGKIRDYRRIRYLRDHIAQVHRAWEAGVPLRGYFVWSLLDNFEWALGYTKRFGLIHVDYETQERLIKQSGHWYAQVITETGVWR
jgi:beta-glucosidase